MKHHALYFHLSLIWIAVLLAGLVVALAFVIR
jgi:hypothetical protein